MIDFHCHLDLYKNPLAVFEEVKKRKVRVLAVTTSPRAYLKSLQYFGNTDDVNVALGFHPELVADRRSEIELFMEQLSNCRYIGEVGVDGTARNQYSYTVPPVCISYYTVYSKSIVYQIFFRTWYTIFRNSGLAVL